MPDTTFVTLMAGRGPSYSRVRNWVVVGDDLVLSRPCCYPVCGQHTSEGGGRGALCGHRESERAGQPSQVTSTPPN